MSYSTLADLPPKPKKALSTFFAYRRDVHDSVKA